MNSIISQTDSIRRRILRIHGTFLFALTIAATANTLIGWLLDKGPYALWHEQQFAAAGLFQAYLLMFVIGMVLWLGSKEEQGLWRWNLIAILAHLPPLSVNFIFADLFASYGFQSISAISTALHTLWIVVELFAIFYKDRSILQVQSLQR